MAGGSFGGTVKLTGESEYRKALKDITANLKLVSSELKLTNTQFASGDNTIKQTKASYNSMKSTLEEQKEKVSNLRKALKEAEAEYGSNNEKVKQFKTQLNNAETQLKQMEDATDKSNKELKNMKQGFDDAGDGALKFGDILKANVLGNIITKGLETTLNGIKKIGSTLLEVGKQALDSYADYEQLVGGVETLFKDNAETVKKYASNAYQTAGLSANDYMETVTSFSASLLQSLDNDTVKAAEVSNRAIIDMSDNANKMGTSMESIQYAYQGFAKQNYTMLDNLKLGYGGTKTEMERLIKDASKMKDAQNELGITVDESSMSFGNIVNAISVMQQSLGIAGTTSKEASTTIQGSVSAMKSAWQNMLTGIADDTAPFDDLINNLLDSILTVSENIMPRVKIILEGLSTFLLSAVQLIINYLPEMISAGTDIINSLVKGIQQSLPELVKGAVNIVNALLKSLIEILPQLIEAGIQAIVQLAQGIGQALPELIPVTLDAIMTIVEGLLDNIDLLIDAALQLMIGLADGIINALPMLIEKIPIIITKIVNAITENLPKIIETGIILIIKLAQGLIQAIPQMVSQLPQIIAALVGGLLTGLGQLAEVGTKLITALWDKLKEGWDNIVSFFTDGIKQFINNIGEWLKELPYKTGEIIGEVLVKIGQFGIDAWNWVTIEMPKIINGIIDWFKQLPENIWNWLLNTIEKVREFGVNIAQKGKEGAVNLFNNIVNAIKELPNKMLEIGRNIVEGLWNGIKNATSWIIDKVKSFAKGILDGMKNALGIHSPSALFRDEVGKFMAEGIGVGFSNEMGNVTRQMQDAIPTQFEVDSTLNGIQTKEANLKESLIEAFKEFKPSIILNGKEIGEFAFEYGNLKYGNEYD